MYRTRLALVLLAAVAAGCAPQPPETLGQSALEASRIFSPTGFSFLPPQGSSWTEKFEEQQIIYLKDTDPKVVSFYTGALQGPLRAAPPDEETLIALVRKKKNEPGPAGRYFDETSTFHMNEQQESCVRYALSAKDRGASNLGDHDFLIMLSVGKFCVHPENRSQAVDIYYSLRYSPGFDPQKFVAEGEKFIGSLQFPPLGHNSNLSGTHGD